MRTWGEHLRWTPRDARASSTERAIALASSLAAVGIAWWLWPDLSPARPVASEPPPEPPPSIRIARIEPLPVEAQPAPAPAPARVEEQTAPKGGAAETKAIRPVLPASEVPVLADTARPREPRDGDSIALGEQRIAEGRFPRQRASYARIGFERYRDAMLALGGRFYLFDRRARRPLAELDPFTSEHRAIEALPPHLSAWPRDVTPYLRDVLEAPDVRRAYDGRATHVVLLPPADIDAAFVGGLDRALRRQGLDIERVASVRLLYELSHTGLGCEVVRVELFDGTRRELDLRLALSGPIPARDGGRS